MTDYTDQGTGTPIVLLHSSMSSRSQWDRLSDQLASLHRVIAIDLYGYGDAPYPPAPASFCLREEALRVQEIVEQRIGQAPFHLVGHSYGGATALRLTHALQERIISLALYEPVAFHLLAPQSDSRRTIEQVATRVQNLSQSGAKSRATEIFIDFWSGSGTYAGLPVDRQRAFDRYIDKVSLDFQAGLHEPLGLVDYAALNLPVCLISSPDSPQPTREIAGHLEETLADCNAHQVTGGHMAPITHAQLVNPIFSDFLYRMERFHPRKPA